MGTPIRSKAIYTGRNFDTGPWVDTHFQRCSRCGWINNTDRNTHSNDGSYEGWGTTFIPVTSQSPGSGFGTNSPLDTMQTPGPAGQMLFSTSMNSTDVLVNSYGTFQFWPNGVIYLNSVTTAAVGVMLLLYNSNIYYINNSSQWYEYTGSWASISADPRITDSIINDPNWDSSEIWDSAEEWDINPYIESTMDAVVGAGCAQCGSLLYTR